MAEVKAPIILQIANLKEGNITWRKRRKIRLARVYRAIPNTMAVINAHPSTIISRGRFLRIP
jgi:hypothetical protein